MTVQRCSSFSSYSNFRLNKPHQLSVSEMLTRASKMLVLWLTHGKTAVTLLNDLLQVIGQRFDQQIHLLLTLGQEQITLTQIVDSRSKLVEHVCQFQLS